jgi:hypothetical protein
MNSVLLVDFNFIGHIQEDEPRLCLDASTRLSASFEMVADCLGAARHLKVVPVLADGGLRFGVASHFVGFEVNDMVAFEAEGRE